ncbi:uncharacterized protein LOC134282286 [Saccostrea cucullata]|uniref:uncharacterized protein LOC134282286 n=1 Tax=Saccostrea cuccullata TaxID=36930 RepID=UPI002ED38018
MTDKQKVISIIQSPYHGNDVSQQLWRVHCSEKDKNLVSGGDKTIKKIDKTGSIIQTIQTKYNVRALTVNFDEDPVFTSAYSSHEDIYISHGDTVEILITIPEWCPVGLCYTKNGDLMVSMRSKGNSQSRVVRYSGTTEIQKIQYDSDNDKDPLFSVGVETVLLLTENGNGDICVADGAGNAVVVVDCSGNLRYKYLSNIWNHPDFAGIAPSNIATDVNTQILICDSFRNIIHIIDCDGDFVCFIEHPCNGGLSIDADHNLVVGDKYTGKIKIIKYLYR